MGVFFLDSGLVYEGTAATVISGLDHLEGETVYGLADGLEVGPFTVASGTITLTTAATKVMIGLRYMTTIETLEPEIGLTDLEPGTSLGLEKELNKAFVYLVETGGVVSIQKDGGSSYDIPFSEILNTVTEEISLGGGTGSGKLTIQSQSALPLFLTGVSYDVTAGSP